jgi:AcrR family transcriptional regulator
MARTFADGKVRDVLPGRRRVGRPSVRHERREQILAAVERCIVEYGIGGTTLGRVADAAGVPRSLIHHHLGTRKEMLRAAASRTIANVDRTVREGMAEGEGDGRSDLERSFEVMFGPRLQDRSISVVIDELTGAAVRDEYVRGLVSGMYGAFVAEFERALSDAFPDAPADRCRTVAHAIVALADATGRFETYAFDPENFRRAREAAVWLAAGLNNK